MTKYITYLTLFSLFLAISGCKGEETPAEPSAKAVTNYEYTGQLLSQEKRKAQLESELLSVYKEKTKRSLTLTPPILLLDETALSDSLALKAQEIAIKHPIFTRYTHHPKTKQAVRNEIMTVRPVLASDKTGENAKALNNCKPENCFRVEMYNYFFNLSSVAFVNVTENKVVSVSQYSDAQPDLNKNLIKLAIEIAISSNLVKKELGTASVEPTMSEIKTSLKNSRCERSHHLCVAPTFVALLP